MICRKCAWAADTYGDAEWLEGSDSDDAGLKLAGRMKAAAAEAHTECANGTQECDCQHWLPGRRTRIVRQWQPQGNGWVIAPVPTRCRHCFNRLELTKAGVIWRHRLKVATGEAGPGKICPGSGMAPLARVTAKRAIPSSAPGESGS